MAKLFLFGVDKLISLIREDNAEAVSKLLSRNPKLVQDRDKNGSTALIVAALLNRLEIGLILILRGADINAADTRLGYTALHIAVEKIHIAFATMLLERGADPNAINSKLFSALHLAALNGCREVVHLLIAKGAGLDPPDSLKRSPLLIAIEVGNTEVACMLIEHGCDITTKDKEKKTPIQNALEKGYLGIATLIECRQNHDAALKRETNAAAKSLPPPALGSALLKSVSKDGASIVDRAPLASASASAPAPASASHTGRDDNSSIVSRSSRRTGLSVGGDADTVVTGTSEAKKKKKKKVVVLTPATEGLEPEDGGGTEEQLVVKKKKKKKIPIASDPDPSLGLKETDSSVAGSTPSIKKMKKKKPPVTADDGVGQLLINNNGRGADQVSELYSAPDFISPVKAIGTSGDDYDNASVSELSVSTLSMSTRQTHGASAKRRVPARSQSNRPPPRLEGVLAAAVQPPDADTASNLLVERVPEDPRVRNHKLRSLAYIDPQLGEDDTGLGVGLGRISDADFAFDSDKDPLPKGRTVLCGLIRTSPIKRSVPGMLTKERERDGNGSAYVSFASHLSTPDRSTDGRDKSRTPGNRTRVDLSSQEAAATTAKLLREQRTAEGWGNGSNWCSPAPPRRRMGPGQRDPEDWEPKGGGCTLM